MSTIQEILRMLAAYPRCELQSKQVWYDFESFIETYEIDKMINKPNVFDEIRRTIYSRNSWFDTTFIILQLNTLTDEELQLLLSYLLRCRLINCIRQDINIFIPCEVIDFYISRFSPSL